MGQSSSFDLRITELIKDWRPLQHNSSILINCKNQQQLQSIIVQIHSSQILHEIAIYNARIHALHPYVCKVAYFNQIPATNNTQNIQLVVYTDRLLSVREDDWRTQRFSQALQGLLTLTKYYGFFCLSERMVRVNQRGQTKIWISENTAKNHRDLPLASEQQALAAIAGLAARKNREVANLLIGCCSIPDALNRLNTTRRKTSSPFNNLSHRTIENIEYGGRENSKLYTNVFNSNDRVQLKKVQVVNVEPHPLSSLNSTQKNMIRNFAKTSTPTGRSLSQHKTKISRCEEDKSTIKLGFIQKKHKKPKSKNIGQTSFDNFLKPTNIHSSNHSPNFQRFQTATNLHTHFTTTSPKNANPSSTFNSSLFPQKPSASRQKHFPDDSISRDITIINNNVSHVVNNITHNHSQLNSGLWRKFRDARTPQFNEHLKNKSMSPLDRKVKLQTPQFLQNRKKQQVNKSNIKSFYNPSQKSPSIISNSTPFMQKQGLQFNSTFNSNEATECYLSSQQSFKDQNSNWKSEKKRKDQKLYTFCQTANTKNTNPKFFKSTFSPTSQDALTPNACKSNQLSVISCFRRPNRTKTTQFNDENNKKTQNLYIPLMQNKIFANQSQTDQLNLQKSNNQYISSTPTIPEEISENLPTTKSISLNANNKNEPQSSEKVSFKKQLKLQFGSLLGPEINNHQSMQPSDTPETPSQTNLEARIQQKKMAFAELKKQAWEVLKDLF